MTDRIKRIKTQLKNEFKRANGLFEAIEKGDKMSALKIDLKMFYLEIQFKEKNTLYVNVNHEIFMYL